jgi:YidC/Oxa1 family membrane protein insertase
MQDQKNTIVAIVLSAIVLIAWQYFFATPQAEKQRQLAEQQRREQTQAPPTAPGAPAGTQATQPSNVPVPPGQAGTAAAPGAPLTREKVLEASPRVAVDTPSVKGSIALRGARIDDLSLVKYRETVDPNSPAIVLLAPSGTAAPFYAEFGWVPGAGANPKLPDPDTQWRQEGSGALAIGRPITLVYDNGAGLEFRRTIAVDENYLFTLTDSVTNKTSEPVTLYPYGLISRHGTPPTLGYYILHEGLIGVMGDEGLQEHSYKTVEEKKSIAFNVTNAWLGITDKYWAATLIPNTDARVDAHFRAGQIGSIRTYQTDYLLDPRTIQPAATLTVNARLFAGAKEVSVVNGYNDNLKLNRFDRLIDWGYLYFITKPMFWALDTFYKLVGNFGISILIVTVIIKLIFFPLANKSYASMAKMKTLQPKMQELRERYPDDKVKQQQELMELYKREKINPVAGCLPILIQVPVFFALYKVLFITIEMRHAPFYGWIKDLSAPDPTTIFNLFGLIPWDPSHVPILGAYLMVGAWPIVMGITMWAQMKLNPPPPDPAQKVIFDWMPLIFTFMLAGFSAGLVIYWAWNNTLSVIQQSVIMSRHGARIELFDNVKAIWDKIRALFNKRPPVM